MTVGAYVDSKELNRLRKFLRSVYDRAGEPESSRLAAKDLLDVVNAAAESEKSRRWEANQRSGPKRLLAGVLLFAMGVLTCLAVTAVIAVVASALGHP